MSISDKDREAANKYISETYGDDCLCQRSQPGTPVGEHLYIGCCCAIAKGFLYARSQVLEREKALLSAAAFALDEFQVITGDGYKNFTAWQKLRDALEKYKGEE